MYGIGFQNIEATNEAIRRKFACYHCGAVPEILDATSIGDAEPAYVAGRWPSAPADHEHAARPPTPEELLAAGHAVYRRIMEG